MSGDAIEVLILSVVIQTNGIIRRESDGYLIGNLSNISFAALKQFEVVNGGKGVKS